MNHNNFKTKDVLIFISSKGCPNCTRIDTKAFKAKLKSFAAEFNKEFVYVSLKANNSKVSEEFPDLPSTLNNFTWFYPLFLVIDKDQWNTNKIIDPYIMDGKIYPNGKVAAIQQLPYPLSLVGVKSWLTDIKTGKISNKVDPLNNTNSTNLPKSNDVSVDNKPKAKDTYKISTYAEDNISLGPFMNDSKIDGEMHFCECTIRPKNKAYRVKP